MNFLAHLTLSCQDRELQMGNLLGDLTKGKPPASYTPGLLRGLELHHIIDRETDRHPAVLKLNTLLRLKHGRYAGVVSDVIFDLYLYRHWSLFGPEPFPEFSEKAYSTINEFLPLLPPKTAKRLANMSNHRWLNTYRSMEGILSVFERMKPRFSKPKMLHDIDGTMRDLDEAFNECFLELFPHLINTVNKFCGCID
ncbi:hypothetical protein CEQ90_01235 [Lewinellaceae bacterium SD302]|nr:hypothetical protein CEQ90_01235 [Lewinellaceae bacterium SD302]